MTPEQQIETARAMRAAEARARATIEGLPVARSILQRRPDRKVWRRTCAHDVEALEAAVDAVWQASVSDETIRPVARAARAAIEEAHHHRNALALSAHRVATMEVRRVTTGEAAEDLLQEARTGLIDAATRFDPERGIRFSTYARWWARARITRARQRDEGLLRVSGGARERRALVARLQDRHPDWTEEDLAREAGLTLARLRELVSSSPTPVSEDDYPVEDDDAPGEADLIAQLDAQLQWERVRTVLDGVDPRSLHVVERHWGLDGRDPETLAQIGRRLGVSRERARQIERSVLREVRRELGLPEDVRSSRGRHSGLMVRVVERLQHGSADLATLARELDEHPTAVGTAAQRATSRGLIRRVERGVYAPIGGAA